MFYWGGYKIDPLKTLFEAINNCMLISRMLMYDLYNHFLTKKAIHPDHDTRMLSLALFVF